MQFFPYTTAVKTPLALFGLIGACAAWARSARRRSAAEWRARLYDWSPLLSLFAVYWAFSLTSGLNIGHRHIIPVYPVLFVMAAGAAAWVGRPPRWAGPASRRWRRGSRPSRSGSAPTTSPISTSSSGRATRGGTWSTARSTGARTCPRSRRWLDANPPAGPVFISYFGSGDIVHYGIKATRIGDANFDIRPRKAPGRPGRRDLDHQRHAVPAGLHGGRGPWDRREGGPLPQAPRPRRRARGHPREDDLPGGGHVRGIPVRQALPLPAGPEAGRRGGLHVPHLQADGRRGHEGAPGARRAAMSPAGSSPDRRGGRAPPRAAFRDGGRQQAPREHDLRRDRPPDGRLHLLEVRRLPAAARERQPRPALGGAARLDRRLKVPRARPAVLER